MRVGLAEMHHRTHRQVRALLVSCVTCLLVGCVDHAQPSLDASGLDSHFAGLDSHSAASVVDATLPMEMDSQSGAARDAAAWDGGRSDVGPCRFGNLSLRASLVFPADGDPIELEDGATVRCPTVVRLDPRVVDSYASGCTLLHWIYEARDEKRTLLRPLHEAWTYFPADDTFGGAADSRASPFAFLVAPTGLPSADYDIRLTVREAYPPSTRTSARLVGTADFEVHVDCLDGPDGGV